MNTIKTLDWIVLSVTYSYLIYDKVSVLICEASWFSGGSWGPCTWWTPVSLGPLGSWGPLVPRGPGGPIDAGATRLSFGSCLAEVAS